MLEIQLFLFVWFGPVWGVFALVGPFIKIFFGVRVRFNNFIVTYLRRLSTLVLKVQTYLIILIWTHLGVFLALFRPFGAIFGLDFGFKKYFETCLCGLSILALEL